MCSVRLLIRVVRMAIWTSGEPESDSPRRYSWINVRFRSLVTVIAGRFSPAREAGPIAGGKRVRRISLRYYDLGLFLQETTRTYKGSNVASSAGIARASGRAIRLLTILSYPPNFVVANITFAAKFWAGRTAFGTP